MGQSASIETPASAPQQMSNVLPADATQRVRVQCLEISNGTLEKLQALLRSGCDAAMLDSLPCQVVDTTSAVTIAELRGSITAPVAVGSAESKPLHLFAVRKTAEASAVATEEEANGLVPLPGDINLGQLVELKECVAFTTADDVTNVLVLYTAEDLFGIDGQTCCLVAMCAACCACCIGLLCCCCNKGDSKSNNNNNNNQNYNNNNQNYNNNNQNPMGQY